MIWRILTVLAVLFSMSATAEPAIRVIDGDTFERGGFKYRLWGIDAPEAGDVCPDGYPAGREATKQLEWFLANDITCHDLGRDRYDRVITQCEFRHTGYDIARKMVLEGFAWDWATYSGGQYADAQAHAREGTRGVWAHGCRWGRG